MPVCGADTILVAVMSYNRGAHLENCIASLERHLPGVAVEIFDDASDCRKTQRVLERLAARYSVTVCAGEAAPVHLGGLRANMNRALERALACGWPFLFLIQDDQQIVRDCDRCFFDECDAIFRSDAAVVQNAPLFFKGFYTDEDLAARYGIDREIGCYTVEGAAIGDTGILHVGRLAAKGFRFSESEGASAARGRELGFRMVHGANPVFMYTPWPRTVRRRDWKVAILVRVNEIGVGAGVNAFCPMTPAEIDRFLARPLEEFPVAERFLRTARPLRRPWWYTACADVEKLRSPRYLLTCKWFNDGPVEYMRYVQRKRQANERPV